VAIEKGGSMYYPHFNHRGDILAVTDAAGTRVATYQYNPWGELIGQTGTLEQPWRYAGYYFDEETSIYYLKARYYDPSLARFLTKDTFTGFEDDPQSLNLYAYVKNNPNKFDDPSGHFYRHLLMRFAGGGGARSSNSGSPNFVVTPKGEAISVPKGATGPTPVINKSRNTTGHAYTGGNGGANGQVDAVRIMNPNSRYSNGYVKYQNKSRQGVNPITGQTSPNDLKHYPLK
jgi:RHS repeat-associated protein